MAPILFPNFSDGTVTSEEGPFFVARGSVCLSSKSALPSEHSADSGSVVAVAGSLGLTFFSDHSGVFLLSTAALLACASVHVEQERELPTTTVSALQGTRIDNISAPAYLSLSADESVLAVSRESCVELYSVLDLSRTSGGSSVLPAASWVLPQGEALTQLTWRPLKKDTPQQREPQEGIIVLSSGRILYGSVGGQMSVVDWISTHSPGSSVAWSPDGRMLAVADGSQVALWDFINQKCCWSADVSRMGGEDGRDSVSHVIGLQFQSDSSLLLVAQTVEQRLPPSACSEEQDLALAAMAVLMWSNWTADQLDKPLSLTLAEFFPTCVAHSGPATADRICAVAVEGLSLTVTAHCKAADQHLSVIDTSGEVAFVDITDDRLSVRIPSAADDGNNFVIGMGVDYTSVDVAVHHPIDAAEPDLQPSPVLVIATSDAKLRFFSLSHLTRIQTSAVKIPTPALPAVIAPPAMGAPLFKELLPLEALPAAAKPSVMEGRDMPAGSTDDGDTGSGRSAVTDVSSDISSDIDDDSSVESIAVAPQRLNFSYRPSNVGSLIASAAPDMLSSLQHAAIKMLPLESDNFHETGSEFGDNSQTSYASTTESNYGTSGIDGSTPDSNNSTPGSNEGIHGITGSVGGSNVIGPEPESVLQPSTGCWDSARLRNNSAATAAGAAAVKRNAESLPPHAIAGASAAQTSIQQYAAPMTKPCLTAASISSRLIPSDGVAPQSSFGLQAATSPQAPSRFGSRPPCQPQGPLQQLSWHSDQITVTQSRSVSTASAIVPHTTSDDITETAVGGTSMAQKAVLPPVPSCTAMSAARYLATGSSGDAATMMTRMPADVSLPHIPSLQAVAKGLHQGIPAVIKAAHMPAGAAPAGLLSASTLSKAPPKPSGPTASSMPPIPSFAAVSHAQGQGFAARGASLSQEQSVSLPEKQLAAAPKLLQSKAALSGMSPWLVETSVARVETAALLPRHAVVSSRTPVQPFSKPMYEQPKPPPWQQQQQQQARGYATKQNINNVRAAPEGPKWMNEVGTSPHPNVNLKPQAEVTLAGFSQLLVPQLAGEAGEAATLETDFLVSLLETRHLEDTARAAILGDGRHRTAQQGIGRLQDVSAYGTKQLLEALTKHSTPTKLSKQLHEQCFAFGKLQHAAKSFPRRMAAVSAFQVESQNAGGASPLQQGSLLEASLLALYMDATHLARQLLQSMDDVAGRLKALEWQHQTDIKFRKLKKAAHRKVGGADALYRTINAQSAATCAQASQLDSFRQRLEVAGQLPSVCYDELYEGRANFHAEDGGSSESEDCPRSPWAHASRHKSWSSAAQHASWQLIRVSPQLRIPERSAEPHNVRQTANQGNRQAVNVWRGLEGEALRSNIVSRVTSNIRVVRAPTAIAATSPPPLFSHAAGMLNLGGAGERGGGGVRQEEPLRASSPRAVSLLVPPPRQLLAVQPSGRSAAQHEADSLGDNEANFLLSSPKQRTSSDIKSTGGEEPGQSLGAEQSAPQTLQRHPLEQRPSPDEIRAANNNLARKVRAATSAAPLEPFRRQMAAAAKLASGQATGTHHGNSSSASRKAATWMPPLPTASLVIAAQNSSSDFGSFSGFDALQVGGGLVTSTPPTATISSFEGGSPAVLFTPATGSRLSFGGGCLGAFNSAAATTGSAFPQSVADGGFDVLRSAADVAWNGAVGTACTTGAPSVFSLATATAIPVAPLLARSNAFRGGSGSTGVAVSMTQSPSQFGQSAFGQVSKLGQSAFTQPAASRSDSASPCPPQMQFPASGFGTPFGQPSSFGQASAFGQAAAPGGTSPSGFDAMPTGVALARVHAPPGVGSAMFGSDSGSCFVAAVRKGGRFGSIATSSATPGRPPATVLVPADDMWAPRK